MAEDEARGSDRQEAEDRLLEVWLETRESVGYDALVDLHWDICKEIVERDDWDQDTDTDQEARA